MNYKLDDPEREVMAWTVANEFFVIILRLKLFTLPIPSIDSCVIFFLLIQVIIAIS